MLKRLISLLLVLVMAVLPLSMTSCGADQSGEWGAYYQAFLALESRMAEETQYLCLDHSNVEEENRQKLYDLFYEYCEDAGLLLYEGDGKVLQSNAMVDGTTSLYKNVYVVKFLNIAWQEDRSAVTMTVSLTASTVISEDNLGATVSVSKEVDGWQASVKTSKDYIASSDEAGLYCAVVKDLYTSTQSVSTVNNQYICLDPSDLSQKNLEKVGTYTKELFGKHGLAYMEATWDELKRDGYVETDTFSKGYQITFDVLTWQEKGKVAEVYAWIKRGDLEAGGGIYTLTLKDGAWEITDVQVMVS